MASESTWPFEPTPELEAIHAVLVAPKCSCEYVDIGVGHQRVTDEFDCPQHSSIGEAIAIAEALHKAGLLVTPELTAALASIRELHKPTLQNVEWFHDQTGKGEALCCPSCRPEDPTDWHPAVGEAGIEPPGFVPSYVVSPCPTLAAVDALDATTGAGT